MYASPHHLERQVEYRPDFLTAFAREKVLQDQILIMCERRRQKSAPLGDLIKRTTDT
jgi:hypothetical protein